MTRERETRDERERVTERERVREGERRERRERARAREQQSDRATERERARTSKSKRERERARPDRRGRGRDGGQRRGGQGRWVHLAAAVGEALEHRPGERLRAVGRGPGPSRVEPRRAELTQGAQPASSSSVTEGGGGGSGGGGRIDGGLRVTEAVECAGQPSAAVLWCAPPRSVWPGPTATDWVCLRAST